MEKIKIELAVGENRRELEGYKTIGIDIIPGNNVDIVANLGFEKIQLEDNSVNLCQAIDFLEHLPRCVWIEKYSKEAIKNEILAEHINDTTINDKIYKKYVERQTPFIFLMNEVYRVLKHNSMFIIETPFSDQAFRRDPTHVNHLSEDWYHYFSKIDNLYFNQGLVTCNFKLSSQEFRKYRWTDKDIMHTELIAIKKDENVDENYEPLI